MTEAQADRQLVDRCLADDEKAWCELFDRCHRLLEEVIRRQLCRRSIHEDIVQEVAARYWYALVVDRRRLERYDPNRGTCLGTYLAHQARMEALSYLRVERRRRIRELYGYGRHGTVSDVPLGVAMQDFFLTLTHREREFLEQDLFGSSTLLAKKLSRANRWQLRHRIREKLWRFLGKSGD